MTRVVTRCAGPTFQEDPEACQVDLAHDPKAYPAEQVTRDGPVEGKRRGLRLVCRLALSSCERTPVCNCIYVYMYMCILEVCSNMFSLCEYLCLIGPIYALFFALFMLYFWAIYALFLGNLCLILRPIYALFLGR